MTGDAKCDRRANTRDAGADAPPPPPPPPPSLIASVAVATSNTTSAKTTAPPRTVTTTPRRADTADESRARARVFCAEDDEQLSAMQHMVAGAAAGMAEHMAMFPVDTLKTRMQSYVAPLDAPGSSVWRVARAVVQTEGLRALWRGVGAVALSAGPAHALYFATYEAVRGNGDEQRGVRAGATAMAGVCATVVSDGVMTPLDVVKQRMQLSGGGAYASVLQCARTVYEQHGVRAFFAGYQATLLMNVPFTALYFVTYESAKRAILRGASRREHEFSAGAHCVAGGMGGAVAAAATNPLDVAKTRLQTQGEVGARRYGGLRDALRAIAREEGAAGLLRGVRARVMFHVPAAAICWTTYEFCKHVMTPTTRAAAM